MRTKLIDIYGIADHDVPVWINKGGESELYGSLSEAAEEHEEDIVEYITQDADGVLTIEVETA